MRAATRRSAESRSSRKNRPRKNQARHSGGAQECAVFFASNRPPPPGVKTWDMSLKKMDSRKERRRSGLESKAEFLRNPFAARADFPRPQGGIGFFAPLQPFKPAQFKREISGLKNAPEFDSAEEILGGRVSALPQVRQDSEKFCNIPHFARTRPAKVSKTDCKPASQKLKAGYTYKTRKPAAAEPPKKFFPNF